jgi:hypothetical protein
MPTSVIFLSQTARLAFADLPDPVRNARRRARSLAHTRPRARTRLARPQFRRPPITNLHASL